MKCTRCGFDAPAEMSFCGQCGARLGVPCPRCGFENPPGYRFCGKCGHRLSDLPAAAVIPGAPAAGITPLAGERRIATVLLADVFNSTDLMEQLGTEAWVELMNRVLQLLAAEVDRFGGRVDQFRGDGLVAFFGATDAHEDDPERAVLAGLAMQEALRPVTAEMQQRNIDLRIRVGINTGEVIVGSVGEAGRHREDTAMGSGVALAARMETAAEPGTVLVSADTYRLVENRFEWVALGEIAVKGISKPVDAYRPLRLRKFTEPPQPHSLALPWFAGRNAQLAALRGCVEALQSGRGGIALVMGAKGMGKSLLISQVRQQVEQKRKDPALTQETLPPLTWLASHSRSYDQATPYAAWVGLLRSWLESFANEAEPDLAGLLRQQAALLWGDHSERYQPYLATLLALPVEDTLARRIAYLRAERLQKQIARAIYSWVEALAGRGPLVLNINDLQFTDASSLALVKHCLPICENAPVLWIASFRPDRTSPAWKFRHYVETEYPHRLETIYLPPLTEDEGRALLESMLGQGVLDEKVTALVIEKAEGNPYYLREIVYALIDQGLLERDAEGGWRQAQAASTFNLPGSLRALLLARIDRLSVEARRVLQIASVIGPLFWRNVLGAVLGDTDLLKSALTQLQRAHLIHEREVEPELGMTYTFAPSLVRDVAYESLLNTQRAAYHRQVAEQLEAIFGPESSRPYHGLLAYHYRQAGDLNKELYHTLSAADEARRVYANADALDHFTRALTLLDQLEQTDTAATLRDTIRQMRFEALQGRHEVHMRMGNIEAGKADAHALLDLARAMTDDPIFTVDALLVQPEVNTPNTPEELASGLQMAQKALALVQQTGDKHREMHALLAVGHLQQLQRDPAWYELRSQALELSRQLGDLRTEVGLLLGIGGYYGVDNLERSTEYIQAALNISQRLEDKETEAWLLAAVSPEHERRGDYYRQLTEYEQKRVAIYREIGNRVGEGHALLSCGQIQAIYLGDIEGGLKLVEEVLERWNEMPDKLFALLRIAQVRAGQGEYDMAWAAVEQARAISGRVLTDIGRAGLTLVEVILHNAQGGAAHWRQALELQAQVRQLVAEGRVSRQYQMAAACETAAAHLGLAGCLEDGAERAEHLRCALEASGNALEIYRQFGFTQIVECSAEELMYRHSLALAANGHDAEASDMLAAAYGEMMRKHNLIPADSPFRKTFLENIALHRQIVAAYQRGKKANS